MAPGQVWGVDLARQTQTLQTSTRGLMSVSELQNIMLLRDADRSQEERVNMDRENIAASVLAITTNPKPKARRQINRMYEAHGLPAPKIAWHDSPAAFAKSRVMPLNQEYPADAFAFRHLYSQAVTGRRDANTWDGNRGRGKMRQSLDHVTNMIERRYVVSPTSNQRMRDMMIASFKYGETWVSRHREGKNDWNKIELILQGLAACTTGFIMTAKVAHVILPPTKLVLNDSGVLDNDEGQAIEWADKTGLFALRGVQFDPYMYNKLVKKELETEEALAIVDVDQRRVAIGYLQPIRMIEALKAKLIDEGKKRHYYYAGRHINRVPRPQNVAIATEGKKKGVDITISNKLYRTMFFAPGNSSMQWGDVRQRGIMFDEFDGRPTRNDREDDARYFLMYNDPSTGEDYISFATQGVRERGKDADAVMAWKHHMTKDEYLNLYLEG